MSGFRGGDVEEKMDDEQIPVTIAHTEHLVLRWAKIQTYKIISSKTLVHDASQRHTMCL